MKNLLTLFLLTVNTGFSQQVDSLTFSYYTGYKATHTIDGKDIRGVYEKKQEIRYRKNRRSYRIDSFESVETFREWHKANLLADSLQTPGAFMHRKIPAKKLHEYLVAIVSIHSDTIFPYELNDIPVSFLKKNELARSSEKQIIDSLLNKKLGNQIVSNVTGYFNIHFHYQGVSYDLSKDSHNEAWYLFISGNSRILPVRVIHFAFNRFLLGELPKKFSGIQLVN